ncbi:hypothetical protein HAX54_037187, partial [Datura stramonium]|nr:hypothetical protein [Datura stramonium]
GFEDIRINEKDRYMGRLGEHEQFIDSSNYDSDDNTDVLDVEAVRGVDLPGRSKSKKTRKLSIIGVFPINYLREDLQLGTEVGLTVMEDIQKGFHAAWMKCYQMLKLESMLDTCGPIGIKTKRKRRGENNFEDVLRQVLK